MQSLPQAPQLWTLVKSQPPSVASAEPVSGALASASVALASASSVGEVTSASAVMRASFAPASIDAASLALASMTVPPPSAAVPSFVASSPTPADPSVTLGVSLPRIALHPPAKTAKTAAAPHNLQDMTTLHCPIRWQATTQTAAYVTLAATPSSLK